MQFKAGPTLHWWVGVGEGVGLLYKSSLFSAPPPSKIPTVLPLMEAGGRPGTVNKRKWPQSRPIKSHFAAVKRIICHVWGRELWRNATPRPK